MSAPIDDGGPFHPVQFMDFQPTTGEQVVREQYSGLSLRDWFAGQAMENCMKNAFDHFMKGLIAGKEIPKYTAINAYIIADAMLAARKETK
jgi:hypothetical protein